MQRMNEVVCKDYNIDMFKANGIEHELKRFSIPSLRGVIRAMHFQLVKQQAKLVRCISGHVYDVIADLRPDSPTFGQWRIPSDGEITRWNFIYLSILAWIPCD